MPSLSRALIEVPGDERGSLTSRSYINPRHLPKPPTIYMARLCAVPPKSTRSISAPFLKDSVSRGHLKDSLRAHWEALAR